MAAATTRAVDTLACRNCGDGTPGRYCPACGQRRGERVLSLRRIVAEAVEDHLSLNSATPRTLRVLLTRPGMLTTEYLQGRIVRYLPPLRLYLIASFVFFLTAGLRPEAGVRVVQGGEAPNFMVLAANAPAPDPVPEGLQLERLPDIPLLPAHLEERLATRVTRLGSGVDGEMNRMLGREILGRAPIAMFLLLPFLAAVLTLLYIGQRRYYVEHFIFSVHLQAFVFLLLTAGQLAVALPGALPVFVRFVLVGAIAWYTVAASLRVYRQPLPTTLARLVLLGSVYMVAMGATMVATILFSLLTMPL
jgi:hypothetical protein